MSAVNRGLNLATGVILVRLRPIGAGVNLPEALVIRRLDQEDFELPKTQSFLGEHPANAARRALAQQTGATFEVWVSEEM